MDSHYTNYKFIGPDGQLKKQLHVGVFLFLFYLFMSIIKCFEMPLFMIWTKTFYLSFTSYESTIA